MSLILACVLTKSTWFSAVSLNTGLRLTVANQSWTLVWLQVTASTRQLNRYSIFPYLLRWFILEYDGKTIFWSFWHFPLHYLNHIATKESHSLYYTLLGNISNFISLENCLKRHVSITIYHVKQGDNTLGSIRPYVQPSILSRMNCLTYDLDVWVMDWPGSWPGWYCRSRS